MPRATAHDPDTECDERTKLGSDHHRADNEDRLVEHDPDTGDHGRHDHEAEVSDGQSSFLACALFQPLPNHSVRRFTRGFFLSLGRRLRDADVKVLNHDGALSLQVEPS
jgi:hypothetical protein